MRGDNKKCVSLGSLEASVFEANPFGDGTYSAIYSYINYLCRRVLGLLQWRYDRSHNPL